MDKQERIETLISRGYFLKELPPPFTTETFALNLSTIAPLWAAHEASLTQQQRRLYPPVSHCARFDMARKGHSRRMLAVPNPVNQYYLSDAIAEHQDEIEAICARSAISLTSVEIRDTGSRAVTMPRLSLLSEKRIQAYATARAILQTDVLSFYHAIYTHSIPWALHGKRAAKRNRSTTDPVFYGNKIDALVRSCQDGQTIGIPVGPDTSRIISEIILCAIENQIGSENFNKLVSGYRYMDDFFLCFSSHVDAESFLAALRESVLKFDLQLNASKTAIVDALSFNEEGWPGDIAQLQLGQGAADQRRSLIRFFTEVIRLSKTWPDESIPSFAVRKTSRSLIHRDNWDIYESFLIRVARENSNCLDSVIKILCTYAAAGYPVSDRTRDFVESMIEDHAPYNHHYEVIWVLWLCRSLSIRLSARSTHLVARIENSLCACMVLMLRSRTLLTGRGTPSDWMEPIQPENLFGEHWMLIYEAGIRKSWALPGAEAAVNADPHFKILRDQRVSFFNASATNIALQLPSIDYLIDDSLEGRRSAILPGAIYAESKTKSNRHYETLGEYYGNDDTDWSILLGQYRNEPNSRNDEDF